jgi:hypothetical protein
MVKLWLGLTTFCTAIDRGICGFIKKNTVLDRAMANTTGIPKISSSKKTIVTIPIRMPPCLQTEDH